MTAGAIDPESRVAGVLASLVPVVCPPEADSHGLASAIASEAQATIAALPPHARSALRLGLLTYEVGSIPSIRHPGRPASRLGRAEAERYFASWWQSRVPLFRELARGVKGLLCLACYEMPAMKAELDYGPEDWIARVKARRLALYSDSIRRHRTRLTEADPLPGRQEVS